MRFVAVGVAGALGALARYSIGLAVGPRSFPWATFGINVSGSFLLGVVLTVAAAHGWSPETLAAVAAGFLGAYTTFSTFTNETFELADHGRALTAAVYVAGSVVFGVLAAQCGHVVAHRVLD